MASAPTTMLKRATSAALQIREPTQEAWRDADWQKLWLLLKARSWTSLAIVPGGAGAPPDFALQIAVTLARIGILHLGTPIHVADGTNISLGRLEQFLEEVHRLNREGDLVLIALPSIGESPTAIALAQKASFSVLAILLGVMSASEAKHTIKRIGRASFLGTAVFHSPGDARTTPDAPGAAQQEQAR
jgi:hypothetical protein